MKFSAPVVRRLRWLNLPGALLIALLQRAPVVRVATVTEEFVRSAPLGTVLRAATAAVAALGAVHSLAGATQIVASVNSVNTTVGTPLSPAVAFVTNFPGGGLTTGSYLVANLPPGLTVPGINSAGVLNVTNPQGTGSITGTPTVEGSYQVTITAYEFSNAAGPSTVPVQILFTIAPAIPPGPPTITTQPAASFVGAVGDSATFTVGVVANPPASFQWKKNGINLAGAIGASLTISDLKFTDAANYVVEVTNSFGTVTSAAAQLTVNATTNPPVITAQPASQTVATGATVVFSVGANGAPTPVFQWSRNGQPIATAISPTLVLTGANVIAGNYTVTATNSSAAITSNPATLTLSSTTNVGRLTNLSILTTVTASDPFFTVGTVLGGGGPGVTKPLLVRAVGPSLVQIGVPGVLADPKLEMFSNSSNFASNDNWGGDAGLAAVFAQLGAFPFVNAQSRDAAVFNSTTPAGSYTVQVSGVGGATGTVIAELYDATPAGAFTANTPRLVDVSVLKQLALGNTITAGFTVGGATAKTVLVRAIGPGLAAVGVTSGFVADPHLVLFNGASVKIAENDNWGGDTSLRAAMTAVGAFALADPASKDAVLLVTLAPGSYSAVADGLNNTSGFVIIEVYEVP